MSLDRSVALEEALLAARLSTQPAAEQVGQQGFMSAGEIRQVARRAAVGPGTSVLDLCCGVGAPGRLITAELGCRYLGIDCSAEAIALARALAGDLPCRFEQHRVPPLPGGRFDVITLFETMLAFPDKPALLTDIASALMPGGRFAFTVEEGRALTAAERQNMPGTDGVWPIPLAEFTSALGEAGLTVTWQRECTGAHLDAARSLLRSYRALSPTPGCELDARVVNDLIASHELWCVWLSSRRIRKYAMVAVASPGPWTARAAAWTAS